MKNTLVTVTIPRLGGKDLTYRLEHEAAAEQYIGCRVKVSVGRRSLVGVIVTLEGDPDVPGIRSIQDVLDTKPSLTPDLLKLANWISDYYLCHLADAVRAALPAGFLAAPSVQATWTGPEFEGQWPAEVLSHRNLLRLCRYLAGVQKASSRALAKTFGSSNLLRDLNTLATLDLVQIREKSLTDKSVSYTREMVKLASEDQLPEIPAGHKARQRVIEYLREHGGEAAWSDLRIEAQVDRTVLNGLLKIDAIQVLRQSSLQGVEGFDPRGAVREPDLAPEQDRALAPMMEALVQGTNPVYLLVGPPGGGKTRVYIELIRKAVELDRGAILLVPEIALTPQVVARVHKSVDHPVIVLHSGMTTAQRAAAWREVREGRIRIVVGPRSAVFAPVQDLGLIIVDEEHEESYKQMDPAPRYHGRDVALMRARLESAMVVLVSATPSLEVLRMVEAGKANQAGWSRRFGSGWPKIHVVDRRRDRPDSPYIGDELAARIQEKLDTGEGILLLITRRGYAPVLLCAECGWRSECENCAVTLTYHRRHGEPRMRCHICDYSVRVPDECPSCGSLNLRMLGMGTQRIEDEIQTRFPRLAPVRMDRDTATRGSDHEELLRSFSSGDAQILLGTQMIAKGHDFPHVTLVGVVNADPSLMMPDFRSSERTFRLLVQAAGRAGRGEKPGEVYIQTIMPTHPLFKAIQNEDGPDVADFLGQELAARRMYQYPPYARMILLTFASDEDRKAQRVAERYNAFLRKTGIPMVINGPTLALIPRVKKQYRWRLSLRIARRDDPAGNKMREWVRRAMEKIPVPDKVQLITDVDPYEVI